MSTRSNNSVALKLVALVLTMGTLSFLAVPFYDWFCRVTGFGGETAVAAAGADRILERTMTIRFDASTETGMPWTFRPVETEVEIRIGETGLAFYEAHNPTNRPVAGTASYNVAPFAAGGYFVKIDCFCFELQVLEPGQTVQMPVTFYVDPDLVDDPEAGRLNSITLSYTFYETDLPEEVTSLSTEPEKQVN